MVWAMSFEGFKETEMGLIPQDWNLEVFSDVIDINPRRTIKKGIDVRFVSMGDIGVFDKKIRDYSYRKFSGGSKFINEDTIMARITPSLENGKTAFVDILDENEIAAGSTEFIILSAKKYKIIPHYVYYLAISSEVRNEAINSMTGTSGRQRVENDIFDQIKIPLPSLNEQEIIANFLYSIDQKIENNYQMNKTLEEIAQAIFKHWFVQFEFPDEHGRPYKLNGGKMVDSEFGKIPNDWEVGTLAELCDLNANSWTSKTLPNEIYYVDLANTKNSIISKVQIFNSKDAPSRAKRILLAGDTIFGTVRPGNRSYTLIGNNNPQLTGSTGFAVLSPKNMELREMVYLIATSEQNINRLTWLADGAAYPAVHPDVVVNELCFLPPKKIIETFHKIVGPLFDQILSNQSQEPVLSKIRDSILPKLMSGKIRLKSAEEASANDSP